MYSDYTFYLNAYKGTISEPEYARLVVRAEAEINRMTLQRAKTATGDDLTAVKYAECAVVDERIDAAAYTWLCSTNLCAAPV